MMMMMMMMMLTVTMEEKERERFVFRQLGPGRGIRRSPLSKDDMSLRLRGGSIYADLWWPFYLLYIIDT